MRLESALALVGVLIASAGCVYVIFTSLGEITWDDVGNVNRRQRIAASVALLGAVLQASAVVLMAI